MFFSMVLSMENLSVVSLLSGILLLKRFKSSSMLFSLRVLLISTIGTNASVKALLTMFKGVPLYPCAVIYLVYSELTVIKV